MKYALVTDRPVATDSRDHTHPGGTANDNSRNPAFNAKLFALFPGRTIRVMDLGCSGGGFVKDVLDAGHIAVGVEGSDYSLLRKRAEWATIPDNLFTADITAQFDVLADGARAEFDVVTAWEVMEHIPEQGLDQLVHNVLAHLATGGMWVMSVSTQHGFHHVTVRHRQWWLDLFAKWGLVNDEGLVARFGDDWVRGPNQNAPESFHLILKRKST
jgi:2-polyprenyl-3-methyl-5-hydroxy-6-metoxy-1,4-benzoquinol methylase